MRFERVELPAFGPFTDFALDFSERPRAVQVVYGPNEAGKSTLLRALTALLYGVPARSGDAHTHEFARLRVGAVLRAADGALLHVVRRKGLKHTLLDRDERPLGEGVLAPLLAGLNEELFQQMFGLDHERLRAGAEALLRGGGQLGESLFDAGSGARSIRRALESLRSEAESLYKARGRTPKLNVQIESVRELRRKLKDATLSPQAYADQQKALRETSAEREQVNARRRELSTEQNRLARALSLAPLLARKEALTRERARLATELGNLGAHLLAPGSAEAETLTRLREQSAALLAFRAEQPARLAELAALARAAEALEQRLGVAAPLAGTLDLPARARLRHFAQEERALARAADELAQALAESEQRAEHLAVRIAERRAQATHGAPLGALLDAIERENALAELSHVEAELARERAQYGRLAAQAGAQLEPAALLRCELPSDARLAELERVERELETLAAQRAESDGKLARERLEANRRRAELFAYGELATEDELARELALRDQAFVRVAEAHERGAAFDPELVREYQRAVAAADQLARRMRGEAQRYAELVRVDAELARIDGERELLASGTAELSRRRGELGSERDALAASLQLPAVRTVHELRTKRGKLADAAERAQRIEELEARRDRLTRRVEEQRCALAAVVQPNAGDDLRSLLAYAKAELAATRERETELKHLEARRDELLAEAAARRARLAESAQARVELARRLADELAQRGVAAALSAEELIACLDDLAELSEQRRALGEARERMAQMEARERALSAELRELAAAAGIDTMSLTFEQTLAALSQRERASYEAATALARCDAELAKLDPELARLAEGAPLELDDGFDPDRARARKVELDAELEQVSDALRELDQRLGALRAGLARLEEPSSAVELAEQAETELANARGLARRYLEVRLAETLLSREIERYRSAHQGPVLARACELFSRLTLGHFRALEVDYDERDEPVLACVRRNDKRVHVDGLSDGTRDQLFLALRIASIERFLANNAPLPLILDDAFVHFDDARAEAALAALGELAQRTQVLFFTHHYRMVQLAQRALGREGCAVHTLGGELAIPLVDHGPLFS